MSPVAQIMKLLQITKSILKSEIMFKFNFAVLANNIMIKFYNEF